MRLSLSVTSSFVVRIVFADHSISHMATGWTGASREQVILPKSPIRAYRYILHSDEYKSVLMHIELCGQNSVDKY